MINCLTIILLSLSFVFGQQTISAIPPAVPQNGFNSEDNNFTRPKESWLKQNDRYIFIIVISILVLAILIWYVTKSILRMRQRLVQENQGHMMMIQGKSGISETVPVDNNGFHKMPDYPVPPTQQQQQQQYTHRY